MKVSHILIASAALVGGPAIAQDAGVTTAGADCASLQAQWDQTASTASAEQLSSAQASADEGKRLARVPIDEAIKMVAAGKLQLPVRKDPVKVPETSVGRARLSNSGRGGQPPVEPPPTTPSPHKDGEHKDGKHPEKK